MFNTRRLLFVAVALAIMAASRRSPWWPAVAAAEAIPTR